MKQLLPYRLANQQISNRQFKSPAQVVEHFGIMQAQDYPGAKWAVALRTPNATNSTIEKALNEAKIVRSWSCRCTWQFMSPKDIRWILDLVRPRLLNMYASYYRQLEIDETIITKSRKLFAQLLKNNKTLTRPECKTAFEKNGIRTDEMRMSFLLLRAALEGLICQGPMRGKQFTFVLLDQWIPAAKKLSHEEALASLTQKYFVSHGPAMVADCAWWSGLTQAEVKEGIQLCGDSIRSMSLHGIPYWMSNDTPEVENSNDVYLLPAFDEYLVGYKDRSDAVDKEHVKKVLGAGNGIFSPVIIVNGTVAGTWKRVMSKTGVKTEPVLFTELNKTQANKLTNRSKDYQKFWALG